MIRRLTRSPGIEKLVKPDKCLCIVCKKEIKNQSLYLGKDMYRHIECAPGTAKWLKSKEIKVTEDFYKKKGDVE